MQSNYGPYRLNSVDVVVAVNFLRFAMVPVPSRLINFAMVAGLSVLMIWGFKIAEPILVGAGIGGLSFILLIGPFISGLRTTEVELRLTDAGLLAITDEYEKLYKQIDVDRMRTVFGRLLIPVSKSLVLVAPERAIGKTELAKLKSELIGFGESHPA